MGRSKSTMFFLISVLFISTVIVALQASVVLFNVTFFVSKKVGTTAGETTEFQRGDTVFLIAVPPLGGRTLDIRVELIYPAESGKTPITLLSRTTVSLTSDTTITSWTIGQVDPTGTYAMRITAWSPTGEMSQNDISFNVGGGGIPIELILAIAVMCIAVAIAAVILISGRRRAPPQPQPAPPQPQPGTDRTIVLTRPNGQTVTMTAMLQVGSKTIPVTTLPQTFGRNDFVGVADESVLRAISRTHFTIGYDYSRGTFTVEDANSTNGTLLNGEDIRGRGRVPLRSGDVISPANVLNIKFISGPA